jgi:glycerophosphoryl diester phosphodiesterase
MNRLILILTLLAASSTTHAGILQRGKVQLICHRTANRDAPENTLESLALAARMGCNVVEVDIRTTLDGQLVLDHDGMLERLTDGMGDIETSSYDELKLLDTGGFMSERFAGMRIPLFADALRVAREQGIALDLDIKEKDEGPRIFAALNAAGMTERVIFGGDDHNADDLRALMPATNSDAVAWLGPDCTGAQIAAAHAQGKFVVANFSANPHEMDLPAMRAAVAAGVDALSTDYPRLAADAAGRPVEAKIAALATVASQGTVEKRTAAIRELSQYIGFPTQAFFAHQLQDPEPQVSRAAAVALVLARPIPPTQLFIDALSSPQITARTNAAWAVGILHAPVTIALLPLLKENDPSELKEVLLALSRCPGNVSADAILPFFHHPTPTVRAAAALALARHQPEIAAIKIPELLYREEQRSANEYAAYVKRGKPKLTQTEIDPIIEDYREHMKLIHALESLSASQALPLLTKEAFRSAEDSSHVTAPLAGFRLWDRIAADPTPAITALGSSDIEVADRAEWMLIKAGPSVLPAVRGTVDKAAPAVQRRLINILAWQGDTTSVPILNQIKQTAPEEQNLLDWAIAKIQSQQLLP